MSSLNKIMLIGHLGQDPELRATASGMTVVNCTLATKYKYKDKDETTWHRIVFFGRLGEIVAQYLKKGAQIYVEGRLNIREYEKDGQKRTSAEVIAESMQMLGSSKKPVDGNVKPATDNDSAGDGFDDIPFAPVDWRV